MPNYLYQDSCVPACGAAGGDLTLVIAEDRDQAKQDIQHPNSHQDLDMGRVPMSWQMCYLALGCCNQTFGSLTLISTATREQQGNSPIVNG